MERLAALSYIGLVGIVKLLTNATHHKAVETVGIGHVAKVLI